MKSPLDSLERADATLADENVRQILVLAERLRDTHGGVLDDAAIQAVAEATSAPAEYVRLATRLLPEKRQSFFQRIYGAILSLEPDVRRHVISASLGTLCGLLLGAAHKTGQEFFNTLMLIGVGMAFWNISVSKDTRTAAISGGLFGGVFFVATSLFEFLFKTTMVVPTPVLPIALVGGGIAGVILQRIVNRNRARLGLKDPVQERQEMLRQLVDLQEKLRSGEQQVTFLCADIVGSTQIKANADPLSVEFTFTEYHNYVEMVVRRYGGRVHSTAGDGVICAFDHPQQAFGAARATQSGLVELNTFRNKVGTPIVLRVSVHTGEVVAPDLTDIKSVNFAHVIDVASHLQRECPPGGIVVSVDAAKHLPGGPDGIGRDRVSSQGVDAAVWLPPQARVAPTGELPPPLPS